MLAQNDWPEDYVAQFWAIAPRKIGKGAAIKALNRIRNLGLCSFEQLMAAWKLHAKLMIGRDMQYVPHPSTWLNQERWTDDPAAHQSGKVQATVMPLANGKVWITRYSPQAKAWRQYRGRDFPWGPSGVWAVDSEWPPGTLGVSQ